MLCWVCKEKCETKCNILIDNAELKEQERLESELYKETDTKIKESSDNNS